MPPTPIELLLPPALDRQAAVALLAERLALEVGRARTEDRLVLDSFDGRLRAAGLRAERPPGRRTGQLTLHEPGAPPRRVEIAPSKRHLASELPPGPVRRRLAEVLEMRALVPVVRLRSSVLPLAVLNGDAKTVVRLVIERAEAVAGSRRIPLAPRLAVEPVLGYDDDLARTLSVLRDRLGLEPAERPVSDEAVVAVGGRLGGVSSKPKVALAPGTRADAAAAEVLAQLAGIAEANVPGTIADVDTEFLHDLRVAVRRARAVLRELEGVHDPQRRAHVRDELKWIQGVTGPVRDLDVQLLGWDELLPAPAGERAAELEPLRGLLERRRAREFAHLRRSLRGARFATAVADWRALATTAPADTEGPDAAVTIDALAADRIRRVYRRMVRDGSAIGEDSRPEALHDLRKRGKELRYLLEMFGGLFDPKVVKPMVKTLKQLQDVLGDFQDTAVQSELLRGLRDDLAAERGGPAALIALGAVLDALAAAQVDARDHFAGSLATFAAAGQRALVRDTFPKRAT
ncbi:MAG: CHAD domain-containing protein [Solirubrobacteraceae bacterium]